MANSKQQSSQSQSQGTTDPKSEKPKKAKLTEREKADKFKGIAERRTTNAVTAIDRLRPLADKSRYVYDEEQVRVMLDALREAVDSVERAFTDQPKAKREFRF